MRSLFLLLLLFCAACTETNQRERGSPADSDDFASALAAYSGRVHVSEDVIRAYRRRAFQPIWWDEGELTDQAQHFRDQLARLDEHGLNPERYGLSQISALWRKPNSVQQLELECALTRALLMLVVDARYGQPEARIAAGEKPTSETAQTTAVRTLQSAAIEVAANPESDIVAFLAAQFPQHQQYQQMKAALTRYRAIAEAGGWSSIPADLNPQPGKSDPRLPLLETRLEKSGDLDARTPSTTLYDARIRSAVASFQRRHGLAEDGVLGQATIEAMNIPVAERISTLLVNLERWRWLERELGQRFLMVNLAGFELVLVDSHRVVFRSPVIVGKPFLSTPIFSSTLRTVEFHPYWNVPTSIETTEIIPKLKRAPGYLASQHMRYVDTDGYTRLRQDPGPWNALGAVKFNFPNPYDVYLHDTPSKNLFKEPSRAFSHGCIRVKDPLALAQLVLGGERAGWGKDRIEQLARGNQNQTVPLSEHLPIHIVYRTSWVDLDGSVQFRADVYGRDRQLAAFFPVSANQ